MEKNPYIKKMDLQKEEHFPIYIFFNLIKEREFLHVCDNFSKGIGQGIEIAVCLFLDEAETKTDKYGSVEFSLYSGEEVIVNYSTFYWYLDKACQRYVELHPNDEQKIEGYLNAIKSRFSILN